jgi:SAM-dependent methyltransferase
MRAAHLLLLASMPAVSACGGAPVRPPDAPAAAAPAPATAPAPAVAPGPAPAPASPDLIVQRTTELFQAFDAQDLAAVDTLIAPEFEIVYAGRHTTRDRLARRMTANKERGYPKVGERTWDDPRVRIFGSTAVFTGATHYTLVVAEGGTPIEADRFETVVWVEDGGTWRAVHDASVLAGIEAERQAWNEVYRAPSGFNTRPNQLLVDTVKGRKPGRALDIAMGQGRNTLFLAAQGWKVTGVDISDEGIKSAQEEARRQKLKFEGIVADVDHWDWGKGRWDLICLIYAGGREVDKIRTALAPGGLVVIEFFMKEAVKDIGIDGFDPGELPLLFKDGFKVLRYDEVEEKPDWGPAKAKLVRFVAQKL